MINTHTLKHLKLETGKKEMYKTFDKWETDLKKMIHKLQKKTVKSNSVNE